MKKDQETATFTDAEWAKTQADADKIIQQVEAKENQW